MKMETKTSLFEPLLEKVEQYGKTNFELLKLKSLNKTADITSTIISYAIQAIVILLFAIMLNIGLAFWIGDLVGNNYYGFLIIASFYGLVGIILYISNSSIKRSIQNSIIKQMFN